MNDSFDVLRAEAVAALRAANTALEAEISCYPTPVSGCDAQFNHLLAERHRIGAALRELDAEVLIATPRSLSPSRGVESR